MASAYSTPKQFENYVQPVNLELVNFVLQSKEQKFNYNIAKVEQTLSDFGNLGLVREEDKEYLADRINTMVSGMGDIENMDWSDSNIERQITTGIKGAIDERVRHDIKLSRNYTNYLKQVQEIKEKEPEKYNDINFAMGLKMAGADAWARGEADDFGNLQYTPYTDVKSEQNEFIKEYIKTHGDESMEEYDSQLNGVTVQRTIKGLSRAQVETIWEANMSPQHRAQLQMEAAYHAENVPQYERPQVVKRYKDNLRQESKYYKNIVDDLKGELSNEDITSEERIKLEAQIQQSEGNIATIESNLNKSIDFETAYMDSYYQMNKNAVVSANSFRRVTDIERDKTMLDAMKVNAQIAKLGREEAEAADAASGANFTTVPSGGIKGEDGALPVYTRQVQDELESSIDGLVASVTQATQDPTLDFQKTFGISAHEFNKKTQQEKESFVQAKTKAIGEGIKMKANGGFTPEVIDAYYNYQSSSAAFNAVNNGIKSAEEAIAKKSFDGMVEGFKGGDFKLDNFKNPVVQSIVKTAVKDGLSFESLSEDERKAFRVAMIDESIRGYHIDQEELMPYILTNRQKLIDEISSDSLKQQFVSNEMIASSSAERLWGAVSNTVKGVAGGAWELIKGINNRTNPDPNKPLIDLSGAKANIKKANAYAKEMLSRRDPADFFQTDEDLDSLNTRSTGERDLGENFGEDASSLISREYNSAVINARRDAGEAAIKMPSTYVISLSPEVEGEELLARKGQQRIAIDKGYGTEDLGKNAVQVHYNKKDNTVLFSTVLKRTAQEGYEISDRIYSNPVPIDELSDMPEIKNRIQRDDSSWALDSRNPNASPVKFTTTGFNDPEERTNAIKKLSPYLTEQQRLGLQRAPHSIGYTKSKIKTMFSEGIRETEAGEQKKFIEEFPNAFRALASGEGVFEINYESSHNQGYFASVDYVVGDKRIPIQYPTFAGETVDYITEYKNSFQRQKQVIDMLKEGYRYSNDDVLDKLREIEEIYGQ